MHGLGPVYAAVEREQQPGEREHVHFRPPGDGLALGGIEGLARMGVPDLRARDEGLQGQLPELPHADGRERIGGGEHLAAGGARFHDSLVGAPYRLGAEASADAVSPSWQAC